MTTTSLAVLETMEYVDRAKLKENIAQALNREELIELIEFLLTREKYRPYNTETPRVCGTISDQITSIFLEDNGDAQEVKDPADIYNIIAVINTFNLAPKWLQDLMGPLVWRWRQQVATRLEDELREGILRQKKLGPTPPPHINMYGMPAPGFGPQYGYGESDYDYPIY